MRKLVLSLLTIMLVMPQPAHALRPPMTYGQGQTIKGGLDARAATLLSLNDILISRGWKDIFVVKDTSGEVVLFHNISIYNPCFGSLKIDDKHRPVDGELSIKEREGFILVCNPEKSNIREIITKGCSICIGVSIMAPIADGRWAFYISHFLNYEDDFNYEDDESQNRAQGGEEISERDDVRTTLDEVLRIFEQLGTERKHMKGVIVGGCGDLGIRYLGRGTSFFIEKGISFSSQYTGGLAQQNRGLKIDVVARSAIPLVQSSSGARYEEALMRSVLEEAPFSIRGMKDRAGFQAIATSI